MSKLKFTTIRKTKITKKTFDDDKFFIAVSNFIYDTGNGDEEFDLYFDEDENYKEGSIKSIEYDDYGPEEKERYNILELIPASIVWGINDKSKTENLSEARDLEIKEVRRNSNRKKILTEEELARKIKEKEKKSEERRIKKIKLREKKQKELLAFRQRKNKYEQKLDKEIQKKLTTIPYLNRNKKKLKNKFLMPLLRTIPDSALDKYIQSYSLMEINQPDKLFERSKKRKPTKYRIKVLNPYKIYKKFLHDRYYGCLVAATFFQILVSNTPIDEEYIYTEYRVKTNKRDLLKGFEKKQNLKLDVRLEEKKKIHKPDKISVRGDWVLSFRGKNFKSFASEPEKNSKIMNIDHTFSSDLFKDKGDIESIHLIAYVLADKTKDFPTNSNAFQYTNLNPRWEILEKGGYSKDTVDANGNKVFYTGSKYGFKHGVLNGFSYQAPKGFIRIAEAYFNYSIKSNRGYAGKFLQQMHGILDVSKNNSILMKTLKKYDPDIGRKTFVLNELKKVKL